MQECTETLRVRADVLRVASDGDRTLEGSGELRVLLVDADGQDALLLLLGTSTVLAGAEDSFSYLLTSSVPVLSLPAIGSFILPPSPDKLSSFQYGIVLDSATPPSKQKKFHDLLDAFADLKDAFGQVVEEKHAGKEEEDKAVILGNKFSASIEKGSRAVAAGLLTGSKAVASRLKVGSDALIKRSAKGRDVKVDAKTKQRFKTASSNAKIACKVSSTLLSAALAASFAVSASAAEAVFETKMGKKLQTPTSERSKTAKKIAAESVKAALLLTQAMEEAALILIQATADSSADIVEHKYGKEVGDTARDMGSAVTDIGRTALSANKLGVAFLAQHTAKQTAITVLGTEEEATLNAAKAPTLDPMTQLAAKMAISSMNKT